MLDKIVGRHPGAPQGQAEAWPPRRGGRHRIRRRSRAKKSVRESGLSDRARQGRRGVSPHYQSFGVDALIAGETRARCSSALWRAAERAVTAAPCRVTSSPGTRRGRARGPRALAGWRAAHHARRSAALLGPGDRDGSGASSGVPSGLAPDRGVARIHHHTARLDLAIPDHSTLSRRAETLSIPGPKTGAVPVYLLVDSTGLRLCGPGEWLVEKHGSKRRRAWRKLHIGVDADTGQIVAATLTSHDVNDASQVGPLLDQVARPITSFTGDGAYDRDDVYDAVGQRHPDAAVIVPPRSNAMPSMAADTIAVSSFSTRQASTAADAVCAMPTAGAANSPASLTPIGEPSPVQASGPIRAR